ncbi:enterobactin exporter EntS [compost metagenome]
MKTSTFNRNFNVMIVGQIITLFGSSILRFALSLYVLNRTGSAETFALLLAISTIPTVILSPIGGAIADRVNRRNLLVIFDFISGIIVGGLALCLYNDLGPIVLIGGVMTLLGVISTFYQPTVQASIPILLEEKNLLKGNGIVSGVSAITNFAGPVLGGLLYSLSGIEPIVIITCVSFLLAATIELFIHMPFQKGKKAHGAILTIWLDLKEGARYVIRENTFLLKVIWIAAAMNVFITPLFLVGIPYIIKIYMQMNDKYFGFTQGGMSLSMICAAVAVGLISSKLKVNNLYIWFIGSGALLIPMAFSIYPGFLERKGEDFTQYTFFTLCVMLIMFVITIINIFIMTTLQQKTPNIMLGKVMAIVTAVSTCTVPVGQIIFGTLIDRFATNVHVLVMLVSLVTLGIGLLTKKLLKSASVDGETEKSFTTGV